jgi:hypothetical protein
MQHERLDIDALFVTLSERLSTGFEKARQIAHPGEHGSEVEAALTGFLKQHLPRRFGVGTGFVVDLKNNVSAQSDIVLYDALNCPRLFTTSDGDGGFDYYPVDGVYGVVLVTDQKLGHTKLKADMDNIERLRSLEYNIPMPPHFQDPKPFGVVFATRAEVSIHDLASTVNERRGDLFRRGQQQRCVNAVVIHKTGVVCYFAPEHLKPSLGIDPAVRESVDDQSVPWSTCLVESGDRSLALFFVQLLHRLRAQAEAHILARASFIQELRAQGRDLGPPYDAAVDAQVVIPSISRLLVESWVRKNQMHKVEVLPPRAEDGYPV